MENQQTTPSIDSQPSATPSVPPFQQSQPTPNKKYPWEFWFLIFLIMAAGFCGGVYFVALYQKQMVQSNSSQKTIPTPTVTIQPTTSSSITNWKTYENDLYSYNYPPDWKNWELDQEDPFYNLTSPNFQMTPLNGSGIIITITGASSPDDTLNKTVEKLKQNKYPYEMVTVDGQQAVQYDEIIAAGTDEDGWEYDYKTITILYKKNKKVELVYFYTKDHKNDSLKIYNNFLTTFKMK